MSPTLTFSGENMTIYGEDLSLHLLHTPGHTPDHLAVWIPEIGTCLAVDAVEHPIPEVWSNSPDDCAASRSSLNLIRSLKRNSLFLRMDRRVTPPSWIATSPILKTFKRLWLSFLHLS